MSISAYRYYRFVFDSVTYTTINEIGLYESADGTGTNRLTGATATSDGQYMSQFASLAIDGNSSTYWSSASDVAGHWIAFDLGAAYTIASMKVTSTTYAPEVPRNFRLQVSTDGSTWNTIGAFVFGTEGVAQVNKVQALNLHIAGTSTLSGGGASLRVYISNWDTGALLGVAALASDGSFEWRFETSGVDVLVTHIGSAGYQPVSDGPITPGT